VTGSRLLLFGNRIWSWLVQTVRNRIGNFLLMPDPARLAGSQYRRFIDRTCDCIGSVANDMEINLGRANVAMPNRDCTSLLS